jgi:hypothetical protein
MALLSELSRRSKRGKNRSGGGRYVEGVMAEFIVHHVCKTPLVIALNVESNLSTMPERLGRKLLVK